MNKNTISNILSGRDELFVSGIETFINQNSNVFTFPELGLELRKDFWNVIFQRLQNGKHDIACLSAIRILSRDKENINEIISEKWIDTLLIKSDLKSVKTEQNTVDNKVVLQALQCLCNLVFQSKTVQNICERNEMVENIFKRLILFRNSNIVDEIQFFDMKLLFLITAYCLDVRIKLKEDLHGATYLTEYLVYILNESGDDNNIHNKKILSDSEVNLASEILKVLFNLATNTESFMESDEDENSMRLTSVLHDYLFVSTQSPEKKMILHMHIINLLTMIPNSCLAKLVTHVSKGEEISEDMEYDGYNMESAHVLLDFLRNKFENEMTPVRQQELLPILIVLIKLSRSSRIYRKYLRKHILPPLRDVHNRPEQGNTLRNSLCRLLTTPVTEVRDFSADLLFILCKENVGRMIKYTGYGNAAGLFASRGLLGKVSLDKTSSEDPTQYSSDSSDSDTEEYRQYKHNINPVLGCYEPQRPDPTQQMTEEQKEHQAMALLDTMDKLMRTGIVQPCKVGEDGRPEPISHVLELQEELMKKKGT